MLYASLCQKNFEKKTLPTLGLNFPVPSVGYATRIFFFTSCFDSYCNLQVATGKKLKRMKYPLKRKKLSVRKGLRP